MILAVGHQGRDVDRRERLLELLGEFHRDVTAGNQLHLRIRSLELKHQCAGIRIDPVVDEVEPGLVLERLPVGAGDLKFRFALVAVAEMAEEVGLAHRELDLHRIVADDRRQRPRFRRDVIAFAVDVRTDPAVERRVDLRIGEIVFRADQIRFRLLDFRLVGFQRAQRAVVSRLGGRLRLDQLLVTFVLLLGERIFGLHLGQDRFGGADIGRIDRIFDLEKQVALPDHAALFERRFLHRAGDPGHNVHRIGGGDGSDIGFRFAPVDHGHFLNPDRRRLRLRRGGGERSGGRQKRRPEQNPGQCFPYTEIHLNIPRFYLWIPEC